MNTLFSNFFYDGICRVIPGIVVIGLYGKFLFIRADHALDTSSVLLTICIFLIAWLIGATLDTVVFALGVFLIGLLENHPKTLVFGNWLHERLLPENQKREINAKPRKETAEEKFIRIQHIRIVGEKVLFRGMMCISAFTFVLWPTTFSGIGWTRYIYSLIGTFAFFVCWWQPGKSLKPKD